MSKSLKIDIPGFRGTIGVIDIGLVYCPETKVSPALVRSIKNTGSQSLIVVRRPILEERCQWEEEGNGAAAYEYVVVAGRRRFKAFEQLQYAQIPIMVLDVDHVGEQETLVENLVRNKNVIAELEAYESLVKHHVSEDEMQKQMGIYKRDLNRLRVLLNMAESTRKALRDDQIAPSTAAALAKIPEDVQDQFFEEAQKWTLTAAREWVQMYRLPSSQLEFLMKDIPGSL